MTYAVSQDPHGVVYQSSVATPITLVGGAFLPSASNPMALQLQTSYQTGPCTDPQHVSENRVGDFVYRYTTVAELHGWDDMTEQFNDIYTASSQIDVGVSTDSAGGPWKLSGSAMVGDDKGGNNFNRETGRYARLQQPQFEYEDVQAEVPIGLSGGDTCIMNWRTNSSRAIGGIVTPAVDDFSHDGPSNFSANERLGHMADFVAGGGHSQDKGSTQRYSDAAEVFGFTYGTVSQRSSNLNETWSMGQAFTGGSQYHLWGDNPGVIDDAQNIYAYSGITPYVPVPSCIGPGGGSSGGGGGNDVGVLRLWGGYSGAYGYGQEVVTTGCDKWNGSGGANQEVSSTVAKADHYVPEMRCGTKDDCFYVRTDVAGSNSFNQSNSTIRYDVNTISVGYASHTVQGGDPSYNCNDISLLLSPLYFFSGKSVRNVGSVAVAPSGLIVSATTGSQGSGSSVTVDASTHIAGPFYASSAETSANTSPQESGVCLSDANGTNGNEAPLTLV